jgi:hypothetical protein
MALVSSWWPLIYGGTYILQQNLNSPNSRKFRHLQFYFFSQVVSQVSDQNSLFKILSTTTVLENPTLRPFVCSFFNTCFLSIYFFALISKATLSSAIASLVGAPRVLQVIHIRRTFLDLYSQNIKDFGSCYFSWYVHHVGAGQGPSVSENALLRKGIRGEQWPGPRLHSRIHNLSRLPTHRYVTCNADITLDNGMRYPMI